MSITIPNAYWKFDESSGNASDATGNGLTLTNNGSASFSAGALNNGTDLGTTGKYFDIADNTAFDATTSISISFWGYLNASPGAGEWAFASSADTTGSNRNWVFEFGVGPNGLYVIASKDGTLSAGSYDEFDSAASILPATGAWHHYVFVYDVSAGSIQFYIDTVPKVVIRRSATQNVTALSTVASKFGIGVAYGTSRTGDWRFDEYGFWKNYKLTFREIAELYNGGTPRQYDTFSYSPVVSWLQA